MQLLGHALEMTLIEPFEIVLDDLPGQRHFHAKVIELNQQTLLQITGTDTGGIKRLNDFQDAFDHFHTDIKRDRNVLKVALQIAVIVNIANQVGANLPLRIRVHGQRELPHQVIG